MKPEAQRIAIAEACGFRNIRYEQLPTCRILIGMIHDSLKQIPDYRNDLNAMHEAVVSQGWLFSDRRRFILELSRVCGRDRGVGVGLQLAHSELINATAAQRAEAFLKTIGKWEEES